MKPGTEWRPAWNCGEHSSPDCPSRFWGWTAVTLILSIVLGLLTGFFGHTLRQRTQLSTVAVSSLLTLLAALALPRIFTEGNQYALVCTAVSYVTMSSTERLAKVWETLPSVCFALYCVLWARRAYGDRGAARYICCPGRLGFYSSQGSQEAFQKGG